MSQNIMIPGSTKPTWSCRINNIDYEYPAATMQTVPDEVAELIRDNYDDIPKEDSMADFTITRNMLDSEIIKSTKMSVGQVTDSVESALVITDFTKNLIKYPYDRQSGHVSQGVTYTYDEYGTTYANGTATANSNGFSYVLKASNVVLKKGRYKLYGSPSGSGNTFFQRIYLYNLDGSNITNYTDYGRGVEFETEIDCLIEVKPYIISGYTANNIVFKPVLIEVVEGKEIPTGYIPTSGFDVSTCNSNILPFPYSHENGLELNGVKWTYDDEGRIVANRIEESSSNSAFLICDDERRWILPKGTYKMSGCPSGGSSTTYRLRVYVAEATSQHEVGFTLTDMGEGKTFTFTEDTVCRIYAQIIGGYDAQDVVFEPMILNADDDTRVYIPPKSSTVHVSNSSNLPIFGLASLDGITNVISPAEISFDYAKGIVGKYVLQNSADIAEIKKAIVALADVDSDSNI